MADQHSAGGSSSSDASAGGSESTVELNIKTLDSQIYSFNVDANIRVSEFKEKIASQIGVPVGQQRLIFRGKVLKDEHYLSEYHIENGHTLHLVERQPSQSQASSSVSSGDGTAGDGNRGQEPNTGGPRNRVGQISHSVVLGTFNVADQVEGIVPDLSRVIGAVINSFGIGSQMGNMQPGLGVQAPQANDTEIPRGNGGTQNSGGSQSQQRPNLSGQSLPQVVQIPVGAAIAVPSINAPIPDSLHTLVEFMSRMEQAMTQNGLQPNRPSIPSGNPARVELPVDSRGLATPEALSIVLRHAQLLIGDHTVAALSHLAGRLEQDGASTDASVRTQIQTESIQLGLAMQHLGALLLELGRTILTLRMGQSPAASSVNAGPAVYISPSGPNPIMAQPFPLQTSPLFGGPTSVSSSPGAFAPIGIGNVPRHVNIHIHAVGARPVNGEGIQGERVANIASGAAGPSQAPPFRNVVTAAVPQQSPMARSGATESGPLQNTSLNALSSVVIDNDGSYQTRVSQFDQVGEMSQPPRNSSERDYQTNAEVHRLSNSENCGDFTNLNNMPSTSTHRQAVPSNDGSSLVPLGLGLGGLQPKRRSKQSGSQVKSGDGANMAIQTDQSMRSGQQVLQSLASLASGRNENIQISRPLPESSMGFTSGSTTRGRSADSQVDIANAMSQVLQSPALNGLLTAASQQTGVGSPDALRNMLEQLTQSPAMRNTVSQIAQQIDGQDVENMMSGLGGRQGGGMDLSRMFQQMMPIVSQALGGVTSSPQPIPHASRNSSVGPRRGSTSYNATQVDAQQVARRIERQSPPGEIFSAMVENAVLLSDGGITGETLLNELSCEDELAAEFVELLRRDISRRLQN